MQDSVVVEIILQERLKKMKIPTRWRESDEYQQAR